MIHLYDAKKYDAGPFSELQVMQSDVEEFLKTKCGQSPQAARELSRSEWKSLAFDSSGKQMLVTTRHGLAMTLDGFTAELQQAFLAPKAQASSPVVDPDSFTLDDDVSGQSSTLESGVGGVINSMEACFTPDDRYVLGGCADGTIQCWDAATGQLHQQMEGHAGPVSAIAFNPKLAMFASSCTNTALWLL
jgi:WD40 repeat protein